MDAVDLVTLAFCDLGAVVRGRSMPAAELERDPEASVGWVPSAIMRPPFGPSVKPNPFGPIGDLRLRPVSAARATLAADARGTTFDVALCDLTEPDGTPWDCCPRRFLRETVDEVEHELGAEVWASFEHEFELLLDIPTPAPMSIEAHRLVDPFPSAVMGALQAAGLAPERFVAEGGPHQFEIAVSPTRALPAADRSVLMQTLVREVARRHGVRATFSPLTHPAGAGNGVHVQLSLRRTDGAYPLYDPAQPGALSSVGGRFAAGILAHAHALAAFTAPSPVSQARLEPGRRSAGAVCLGLHNREALVRIPPLIAFGENEPARQMRLEYRGADAAANPYLALGVLLRAGLAGVRGELPAPVILTADPASLGEAERRALGVTALPETLAAALHALARDEVARGWLPARLHQAYVAVKGEEVRCAAGQGLAERCCRYALLY